MTSASEHSDTPGFVVRGLHVAFGQGQRQRLVLRDVHFSARPGRITGVVGESGSGKTTAVLASIGFQPPGSRVLGGEAWLDGRPLLRLKREALRELWGREISYVGQDAAGALNPAFRIGAQLAEVLTHKARLPRDQIRAKSIELLRAVHLPHPEDGLRKYPHEFSGGQLQRIAIALAVACRPSLLILDEPTTGLDVTTQAEVVSTLTALIHDEQIAAVYISHDLALVSGVADVVVVLYSGEVVEEGPTSVVVATPRHPYTRGLLDSILSTRRRTHPKVLEGRVPGQVVEGSCSFAPRCRYRIDRCTSEHPPLVVAEGEPTRRLVRCARTVELGVLRSTKSTAGGEVVPRRAGVPLLETTELVCSYGGRSEHAVDCVSIQIWPQEIVGLVGESGSGKTTLGRSIAGIHVPRNGSLLWNAQPLAAAGHRRTREQRRDIQLIFQNAHSSLNPHHTVGQLISRSIKLFRDDITDRRARSSAVAEALHEVRLDPSIASRYPHELSGGQKQRVAVARAFVARPKLVVCDEIVSSQDVSIQAALLELVRTMAQVHGAALLLITHDLAVVRSVADYVYVMQNGRLQEEGPTEHVFDSPANMYTQTLIAAASAVEENLETIERNAHAQVVVAESGEVMRL